MNLGQSPQPTVFIVDDDYAVRTSLQRLVTATGLQAEAFASGEEFLQHDPPSGPVCIVLDICMPGLNGLALQQKLDEADRRDSIVFITGNPTIPSCREAIKGGAVDFLIKPFEGEELLRAVRNGLDRHRALLLRRTERNVVDRCFERLTPREGEVFTLVAHGMSNKRVARTLGISIKTVKVHRGRVMKKMGADSLADLVRAAAKLGVVPLYDTADSYRSGKGKLNLMG